MERYQKLTLRKEYKKRRYTMTSGLSCIYGMLLWPFVKHNKLGESLAAPPSCKYSMAVHYCRRQCTADSSANFSSADRNHRRDSLLRVLLISSKVSVLCRQAQTSALCAAHCESGSQSQGTECILHYDPFRFAVLPSVSTLCTLFASMASRCAKK
jgi:hypothetical protein